MEDQKSNSTMKVFIGLLLLLLIGSFAYTFKLKDESESRENVLISEKAAILKQLAVAKDSLESALSSKTVLSEDLMVQKDKLVQLMAEIDRTNSELSSMMMYKSKAEKLKINISALVKENGILKKQNELLIAQRDSTSNALAETKNINYGLSDKNRDLERSIEKANKLSVVSLRTTTLKVKSSGKQTPNDKAGSANLLKIEFTIPENGIVRAGDKTYYVQIIDSKNNVLGEKISETFDGKSLTYSYYTTVEYANKTIEVKKEMSLQKIEAGTYFVNVFDKSELITKTSFILR
jgi:hypothetical protein